MTFEEHRERAAQQILALDKALRAEDAPGRKRRAIIKWIFDLLKNFATVGAIFVLANRTKSPGLRFIAEVSQFLLFFYLLSYIGPIERAMVNNLRFPNLKRILIAFSLFAFSILIYLILEVIVGLTIREFTR